MDHDALDTYLNDHLAGATLGADHARQLQEGNEGTPLGEVMAEIAPQIDEDRDVLIDLMERLGTTENALKKATAWMAEKAGRPKFSGATSGDPQLGTFLAVEALSLGVEGKHCLWSALSLVADRFPELAGVDFEALMARAKAQRAALEEQRAIAAVIALDPAHPS